MGYTDKKIQIKFKEYEHNCVDGCCLNYGTITTVNGVELPLHNTDYSTIVKQILEHLGYDVDMDCEYDND